MNSVQVFGTGVNLPVVQQIDPSQQAARVSVRPLEHAAFGGVSGGHYRFSGRSGAITAATVVAGAPLFSFRWAPVGSTNFCVLTRLVAFYIPTTVFTAAQELGLDAMHVTGFTVADSTGSTITPTKMRQIMPASLVADMRIAGTNLLTAGTRTLDSNAFIAGGGLVNVVNAAAATAYVNPNGGGLPQFGFDYCPNVMNGEYPMVLAPNEGFLVRNTVIFPAAGAATLVVHGAYAEVLAY